MNNYERMGCWKNGRPSEQEVGDGIGIKLTMELSLLKVETQIGLPPMQRI